MKTIPMFILSLTFLLTIALVITSPMAPGSHAPESHAPEYHAPEPHAPESRETPESHDSGLESHDDDRRDGGDWQFGDVDNKTKHIQEKVRERKDNITREVERKHPHVKLDTQNFTTVARDDGHVNMITVTTSISSDISLTDKNKTDICNTLISLIKVYDDDPDSKRNWTCIWHLNGAKRAAQDIGSVSVVGSYSNDTNTTDHNAPWSQSPEHDNKGPESEAPEGEDHDYDTRDGGDHEYGEVSEKNKHSQQNLRNHKDNITHEVERRHPHVKFDSQNFTTVIRDDGHLNLITVTTGISTLSTLTDQNKTDICDSLIEVIRSYCNDSDTYKRNWTCVWSIAASVKRAVQDVGSVSVIGQTLSSSSNSTTPTPPTTTTTPTTTMTPTPTKTMTPTPPTKPPSGSVRNVVSSVLALTTLFALVIS